MTQGNTSTLQIGQQFFNGVHINGETVNPADHNNNGMPTAAPTATNTAAADDKSVVEDLAGVSGGVDVESGVLP